MIKELFSSELYLCMSDSTLTYIPQFLFVCDEMQAPGEKAGCWLFFLSFIIPSPLTQGLQAGA